MSGIKPGRDNRCYLGGIFQTKGSYAIRKVDWRIVGNHKVEVVCRVTSAVSCIVIKSDFFPRRIPAPGQLVRIEGGSESFVVMEVDRRRRMVQLMERTGKHRLFEVPLRSVRVFNRQLAQAIHRFLDACDQNKSRERS